jgi:hypothetical protein
VEKNAPGTDLPRDQSRVFSPRHAQRLLNLSSRPDIRHGQRSFACQNVNQVGGRVDCKRKSLGPASTGLICRAEYHVTAHAGYKMHARVALSSLSKVSPGLFGTVSSSMRAGLASSAWSYGVVLKNDQGERRRVTQDRTGDVES